MRGILWRLFSLTYRQPAPLIRCPTDRANRLVLLLNHLNHDISPCCNLVLSTQNTDDRIDDLIDSKRCCRCHLGWSFVAHAHAHGRELVEMIKYLDN